LWPDEKAKLNYYPKPLVNPGLMSHDKKEKKVENIVSKQMCNSGVFKTIKEYPDYNSKLSLITLKKEKAKLEKKQCLNFGCNKLFFDTPEAHKKHKCIYHPGRFDHGCTGIKMNKYVSEMNLPPKERKSVLWEPHWTCCIKGWDSPGCKKGKHSGLFPEEVESQNLRPFKWPDVRAKLYFTKNISDKWKASLEHYQIPIERLQKILASKSYSSSDLVSLCDSLHISMLVIDEKPDFHLKFNDIVNNSNTVNYFLDKNGNVINDKFIKWWFSDYAQIYTEMTEKK